jgi:hypothetical protein
MGFEWDDGFQCSTGPGVTCINQLCYSFMVLHRQINPVTTVSQGVQFLSFPH